jgi:hypothetical protein
MKKILAFLMILGFASSSCEPDDICDPTTPTTPRMLIQFFDFNNANTAKSVTNLKVIGNDMTEGVVLSPSATGDGRYVTSGNNILLPLNPEADIVKYKFIINYGDRNPLLVNEDNLEFKYTRQNIYVSRACGFKTIFDLDTQKPFTLTDAATADQMWIKYVRVERNNISDESIPIIKIYF